MCDAGSLGVESWVYNDTQNVGWQITDRRTTGSVTESITTQNNLAGSLATLTYPSGRILTYTYNGAERSIAAQDVANGITYASNATYAPPGELSLISEGSNVKLTNVYNSRLQPCWIYATNGTALPGSTLCTGSATTGNIIDLKYNFAFGTADNGNVASITNDRVPNRSQSFTYDTLNRITSGATTATHATDPTDCWGEAYVYDVPASTGAWGNLIQINPVSSAYTGCTQEGFNQTVTQYNQISGWCYDLSGNLRMEAASPCPSPTYSYNAENQLTSTTAGVSYTYDGDGKRVSKSNGKLYWYGGGTAPIAETDASGNTTDEYIFFGAQRIARRDSSGNIVYYMADHLGTSRIVTNATGAILDESDFYPFGGERVITASSGNTYKFTGKERDAESNLDNFGARYNASSMGRWMSPDPKILSIRHIVNPQKWNKYAYTTNNPLSYFDPDGLEEIEVQVRAFIPQKSVTVMGTSNGGDNRKFSTAANASSRTSITVRIETDASIRANPIISVSSVAGQSTRLDANGNVIKTATASTGLPTVSGTRDSNGNVVLNFQQATKDPLSPGPQVLTPAITTDLNVTINPSTVTVVGSTSPFPGIELNVTPDGQSTTNIPLNDPGPDGTPWSLFGPDNTVFISQPLPPPPPACTQDKDNSCQ
jgi:RHS repeat-associated protein